MQAPVASMTGAPFAPVPLSRWLHMPLRRTDLLRRCIRTERDNVARPPDSQFRSADARPVEVLGIDTVLPN